MFLTKGLLHFRDVEVGGGWGLSERQTDRHTNTYIGTYILTHNRLVPLRYTPSSDTSVTKFKIILPQ